MTTLKTEVLNTPTNAVVHEPDAVPVVRPAANAVDQASTAGVTSDAGAKQMSDLGGTLGDQFCDSVHVAPPGPLPIAAAIARFAPAELGPPPRTRS